MKADHRSCRNNKHQAVFWNKAERGARRPVRMTSVVLGLDGAVRVPEPHESAPTSLPQHPRDLCHALEQQRRVIEQEPGWRRRVQ